MLLSSALIWQSSEYQDIAWLGAMVAVGLLVAPLLQQAMKAASNNESSWLLDPNGLPDAIITSDLNGNIINSNRAATELLPGCRTIKTIRELFNDWHSELADREQADQLIDAVLSAPDFQYSETLRLSSGKVIERQTRPLPNHSLRIWIIRDLTVLQALDQDMAMHSSMVEEDAARTAAMAEQLFLAKSELEANQAELRRLANTDSLTGLYNRRRFAALGQQTIAETSKEDIWIIMMDIDHFKRINDTYGHAAGDVAIKDFATIAKNIVGDAGFIGRMGGEEFAAILSNTDRDTAIRFAEDIRKACAASQTVCEAERFRFTVSIGVSAWLTGELSIEAALDRSDQALYSAKSYGRNRVVGYEFAQS
ncbi:MAG: diguanylate cyclase [Kordiimonadaceae bacterium]|nr:diguanylate cyclase [Kordiimonadaceae bacterium]